MWYWFNFHQFKSVPNLHCPYCFFYLISIFLSSSCLILSCHPDLTWFSSSSSCLISCSFCSQCQLLCVILSLCHISFFPHFSACLISSPCLFSSVLVVFSDHMYCPHLTLFSFCLISLCLSSQHLIWSCLVLVFSSHLVLPHHFLSSFIYPSLN